MNERIKELDAQAVEYAVGVCDANGLCHYQEYLQVVKEKFAELIIRECAEVLDTWNKENGAEEGLDKEGLISLWSPHFGVKE